MKEVQSLMEFEFNYFSNPENLRPYIDEAKRVGKIPWTCSMIADILLNRKFNYKLDQETFEETQKRRLDESIIK